MKSKIWLGEDSAGLFLEDLRGEIVSLSVYGEGYSDGGNEIRILEGVLPDAGWVSKFQGVFDIENGVYVPRVYQKYVHSIGKTMKRTGNFATGKKVLKTSLWEEGGKKEGLPSGTHVYIDNHPFYTPAGLYMTTSRDIDRKYHWGTKSLEERMKEQGIAPRTRVELIGSDADDIIWRIFQTYACPALIRSGPGKNNPPLLVYEPVA